MKKSMLLGVVSAWIALFSLGTSAADVADYAREKKWADEVVPGLVVGDPVYLQTPRGHHKFLTLFTPVDGTDKAAIVIHGMGIHPDWGMVGTLRTELADFARVDPERVIGFENVDPTTEVLARTIHDACAERLEAYRRLAEGHWAGRWGVAG